MRKFPHIFIILNFYYPLIHFKVTLLEKIVSFIYFKQTNINLFCIKIDKI